MPVLNAIERLVWREFPQAAKTLLGDGERLPVEYMREAKDRIERKASPDVAHAARAVRRHLAAGRKRRLAKLLARTMFDRGCTAWAAAEREAERLIVFWFAAYPRDARGRPSPTAGFDRLRPDTVVRGKFCAELTRVIYDMAGGAGSSGGGGRGGGRPRPGVWNMRSERRPPRTARRVSPRPGQFVP